MELQSGITEMLAASRTKAELGAYCEITFYNVTCIATWKNNCILLMGLTAIIFSV